MTNQYLLTRKIILVPARHPLNKLHPIEVYLTPLWPNLTDGLNSSANYQFWEHEWKMHGTCSDYPNDPFTYLKFALHLKLGLSTSNNSIILCW
ncbi:ribonuclease MC-like [Gossypium australe]|uniref:Ribonuclease MC-like n=1 Tax=Gossypium australe TaxID=47621 RepID=A0A5B6WGX8_9ROSI|nr:ribonuclease MC-like [Gossypium australe]